MKKRILIWLLVIVGIVVIAALWVVLRGKEVALVVNVRGSDGTPLEDVKVKIDDEERTTDAYGDAHAVRRVRSGSEIPVVAVINNTSIEGKFTIEDDQVEDRSAELTITLPTTKSGWLRVEGSGYQIAVNDQPAGESPRILRIPLGPARIRVAREGFEAKESTFTVTPDTLSWAVQLSPATTEQKTDTEKTEEPIKVAPVNPGKMSIVAIPTGAVYIDGVLKRPNPDGLYELTPGKHHVLVDYPPSSKWEDDVAIRSDSTYNLLVDFNRKVKVIIAVPKDDKGERVFSVDILVDGQVTGKHPPITIDIPLGVHTIEVKKDGYTLTNPVKKNFTQDEKESLQFFIKKNP